MGLLFFKVTRQIKYQTRKYCKSTHNGAMDLHILQHKKDYTSIATLLEISIVIMPSHISDIIILVRVGHIF